MRIGIFDSGLGGLTVVHALEKLNHPLEMIYIGDTLHLPFGNKSPKAIFQLSQVLINFLIQKKCDLIISACHSATATNLENFRHFYTQPIIGVIDPAVNQATQTTQKSLIGVIGTKTTIESNAYPIAITKLGHHCIQKPCPLFVPIIEEDMIQNPITPLVIDQYLNEFKTHDLDTLILGCTHYPLIQKEIQNYLGSNYQVIDSATPCAKFILENYLNRSVPIPTENSLEIYVTDKLKSFHHQAELFLNHAIQNIQEIELNNPQLLEKYP